MLTSWKYNLVGFVFAVTFCIGVWSITSQNNLPPKYTNMTDEQSYNQTGQVFSEYKKACEQVGGIYWTGFTDVQCTDGQGVRMQYSIDTSWYKVPIDNPLYELTVNVVLCFVVIAVIAGILACHFLFALCIDIGSFFEERKRPRSFLYT